MAGPQFQSIGARATSAGSETISPAKPGVSNREGLLIALVATKNNATHFCSTSGWDKVAQVNSGANFTVSVWKADEGAGAPTFTWTGSVACAAQVAYYLAPDVPVDKTIGATTSNTGNTSPHTTVSIDTTRASSNVIYIDAAAANTAVATPAGWTENADGGSATDAGRFAWGQKKIDNLGDPSGAISISGAAADWVQFQIEIMYEEADGLEVAKVEAGAWLEPPEGFNVSKIEVGAWLDDDPAPPPTAVSQAGMYVLGGDTPPVDISQAGLYALAKIKAEVRIFQAGMYSLTGITAEVKIPQAGMYVLAAGAPCVSEWCQIWKIVRRDGQVFRFTSLDQDFVYLGETYKACESLNPTATEAVAQADEAGTMDLSGALGEDGITERELYMGLFDGAYTEVWLVPYNGEGQAKRLVRGNWGPIEQTDTGFKVELIGDGARLLQTPLVSLIQPDCEWEFGDSDTCGKDLGPLTVTGTVDSAVGQRAFTDAARIETAGYFTRGKVTFTSGSNAGISAEIRQHADGGVIHLWPRLPFPVSPGDEYSMTPGCTNTKATVGGCQGCTDWGQLRRYGGFDKVPGGDFRSTPAKVR